MARVDWAVLCDHAFFDRGNRLCLVGIFGKFSARTLPLALGRMMVVAHLTDVRPVEEIEVSVAVVTPTGRLMTPRNLKSVVVEMVQEYVMVTLRELPLKDEGVYQFQIALMGQSTICIEVPLLIAAEPVPTEIH